MVDKLMAVYDKILVAVDFSPAASVVLSRAQAMMAAGARREVANEHLILLHVVEYLPPITFADEPYVATDWLIDENDLVNSARLSLQTLAQRHNVAQARQIVQSGTPKQAILQAALDADASLIIIGSHGRHGFSRLLGSTASAVVQQAACDVLAVRIGE